MADAARQKKRHRRELWRCPSCDALVPRSEAECACGFVKQWRNMAAPRGTANASHIALAMLVTASALFALWLLLS